ncbi:hypothetical protein [Cyclobacterium salsum]|uniref:hypothetical protein n=1 Tax=Cyclobacterium salsum TaxID=2666329 RepID=UPI0013915B5A|nr:hypothetical protein [Cyclobacterium salsum]
MKKFIQIHGLALLLGFFSSMTVKAQEADPEWIQTHQQDGITISYAAGICGEQQMLLLKLENSNAQAALVDIALEKEENGHKEGVPPFHVQIDANSAKVMDCQELGPHGMMPMVVEDEASVSVNIAHLLVNLL